MARYVHRSRDGRTVSVVTDARGVVIQAGDLEGVGVLGSGPDGVVIQAGTVRGPIRVTDGEDGETVIQIG